MLYRVRFNHHYNHNKEDIRYHEYLMEVPSFAMIMEYLKTKHPEGYIEFLSGLEVHLYDGDVIDITPGGAFS